MTKIQKKRQKKRNLSKRNLHRLLVSLNKKQTQKDTGTVLLSAKKQTGEPSPCLDTHTLITVRISID